METIEGAVSQSPEVNALNDRVRRCSERLQELRTRTMEIGKRQMEILEEIIQSGPSPSLEAELSGLLEKRAPLDWLLNKIENFSRQSTVTEIYTKFGIGALDKTALY